MNPVQVTFSQGGFVVTSQPTNSFHLHGKGTVAIDAGMLRIEGRVRRLFRSGKPLVLEYPLSEVRNAGYAGKLVRFELRPDKSGKGASPFVTLWAADEAAALSLARELGDIQTEEFARASREQSEFDERLVEATPRTFVTPLIVAVNVAVFVAMAVGGAGIVKPEGDVHVRWGSNFGLMTASGEWWRLATSMFLHFGIIHLALNMAALWDFGRLAERFFGNWTFLAMYLLAGISGSTLSLLWHPAVNSAGASGAVFGVFGMLAGYLVHKELGVPMTVMKRHWGVTLPFIGYNLFIGATVPGIDNAAHIGGLIAGFVMGYALARPLDPEARTFSRGRLAGLAAVAIGCAALAMKPLAGVADNARTELGALEAINSAILDDKAGSESVKEAIRGLESGKIAPAVAAGKLQEAARRYGDANKRLTSYRLGEGSRQRERHEALVRYTALRSEGYELLSQAIRTNDEAIVAKARDRIQQSNEVVKAMGSGRPER